MRRITPPRRDTRKPRPAHRSATLALTRPLTWAALVGLAFLVGTPGSQAGTVVYVTPTGATVSDSGSTLNENAEADFTATAGSLTITLTNYESDPQSVAQAISAFSFTLSNGNLTGSSSNSLTVSAPLVTIDSNGNVTDSTGPAGFVYTPTSSTGLLDVLSGTGHAGPADLIIGPPPYPGKMDSISGTSPHNPFINQTTTFTITGPNITANTTVTAATFQFGTTEGSDKVSGTPEITVTQALPEPGTFASAAAGLIVLALVRLSRSIAAGPDGGASGKILPKIPAHHGAEEFLPAPLSLLLDAHDPLVGLSQACMFGSSDSRGDS